MFRFCLTACLVLVACVAATGQTTKPQLFQKPTINQTRIVFAYAGDLWSAPRNGGEAVRLTTGPGIESDPFFSPDGKTIAFTGEYDGNVDVFTIPATGGVPKRLTYHPGADAVTGWTPDGAAVLFRSSRASGTRGAQLWTVPKDGGFPTRLPLYQAESGAYSPDGKRIAYMPLASAFESWKRYRGGRTCYIQIASLPDLKTEKIPRENSNDLRPMWIGDKVYFLSDRNGPVTLFSYDPGSKQVKELVKNEGFDLKSASAWGDTIAYEQFGGLFLFDVKSGNAKRIDITLAGDLPEMRTRYVSAANSIRSASLSPTGARAVFDARGEILTVPAEKGDIRNLTQTVGVHERFPAWSPDGKSIAYFSDESGEYALHIVDQQGTGAARKIALGEPPTFYFAPKWSPDSKKLCFSDKRLNVWYLDLDKGTPVKVDTDLIYNRQNDQSPVWSPDSKWIAYSRLLDNRLGAIFVYSLETGKSTRLTDGMSDAQFPAFDRSGKYLYFTASTNVGPTLGEGLSSLGRTSSRNVYVLVLDKTLPSPFAPESDEEKVAEAKPDTPKPDAAKPAETKPADAAKPADAPKPNGPKPAPTVRIDFDGVEQRILPLPVPNRFFVDLQTGRDGILFIIEGAPFNPDLPGPTGAIIHKYDLNTRKLDRFLEGVSTFVVSANGEKALVQQGPRWSILPTMTPFRPGEGGIRTEAMEVKVDPTAEWKQMYREVWRGERDFFYSPQFHGLDLKAAEKRYEPFVASVASREDLNYLFREMLGELTVSHLYVGGGDQPPVKRVPGGLLGADYKIENGRYRFATVYTGESWNPQLRAPLTQPGVNVAAGEYLLAVNGVDLKPPMDIDALFEGTAGKSVVIKVGSDPTGANSRDVTVVPVASEAGLRNLAWIEANRRRVAELSGGKIAYIYLPDTFNGGYTFFNRYFFSQLDKEAALIDERYNGGGALADYVVDYLRRPLLNFIAGREGQNDVMPYGAIFGPKIMLVDEYAGSGGDAMPYYFRKMGIGPLMGKRTWGGLVRAGRMPVLMDGGFVTAPDAALWSETGEWIGENKGIAPDIEIEQDPAAVAAGGDPQLEAAVRWLLKEMEKNPARKYAHPPYSDYHGPKK